MAQMQTIKGRYQLEEQIGAGSMGLVYRALDVASEMQVAVKQMRAYTLLEDPKKQQRFWQEGQLLRDLNHPNIVNMLDMFEENGQHYIVMEYIAGGDLHQALQARSLSIPQVLRYALDLADALTRAHKLDIIHRDIKPANILLAADDSIRLTDFGVAQLMQDATLTAEGQAIGTIGYMAPEVLNGTPTDKRADIWSFGVVLYEILTRRSPFAGETTIHTMRNIMSVPPPAIRPLRDDVPTDLIDLIYRMLDKDPYTRISSVRRVGVELEELLAEQEAEQTQAGDTISISRFGTGSSTNRALHLRSNLPISTTPFVGRDVELEQLRQLFNTPHMRLVTIMGPGGIGKTSIALEAGRQLATQFTDGAYLVELAPLSDPAEIIPALAHAIGYPFQNDERSEKQQVLDYLRNKELLLILDNYEHLMPGRALVGDLLRSCPAVRIIVTSREKLNQPGEHSLILSSMEVPDWSSKQDALKYSAVQLFVQSARRVRPDYALDEADLQAVARICRAVQGLPLGIVLAAAWVTMLDVQEVAEEIEHSIDFLQSQTEGLPERQQNLRAVFDYSWNLLNKDEREAFVKLSVFRGGFTRRAAQAISGTSLTVLMALLNKSLIARSPDTGRFTLHAMLRQYAETFLAQHPENASIQDAYSRYYLEAIAAREDALKDKRQLESMNDIALDILNVRAAWDYALAQGQHEHIRAACEAIALYMMHANRDKEGAAWFRYALDQLTHNTEATQVTRARLVPRWVFTRWNSTRRFDDIEALVEQVEAALDVSRSHLGTHDVAYCTVVLGFLHTMAHRFEISEQLYNDAYALFEQAGDQYYMAFALYRMGFVEAMKGRLPQLIEKTQQSLDLRRGIGDLIGEGASLNHLGVSLLFNGEFHQAASYLSAAIKILEPTGNLFNLSHTLANLALLRFMHGEFVLAYPLAKRAWQLGRDLQQSIGQALGLSIMGAVDCLRGDAPKAQAQALQAQAYVENASIAYTSDLVLSIISLTLPDHAAARGYVQAALGFALRARFNSMLLAVLPTVAALLADPQVTAQVQTFAEAPAMQWAKHWGVYQALLPQAAPAPTTKPDLLAFAEHLHTRLKDAVAR